MLDRIFAYLVNNSSSLASVGNIVNYLNNEQQRKEAKAKKQNYETVSSYIEYLQEPYLILKADRYDVKGKEILKGAAKYYANDNCYHNYLFEGYGYGQGSLLENYVFQALRRAGYEVYVGKLQDAEVDFVCINRDDRLYVQSSWTLDNDDTAEREYKSLESIADSYPKIIVSMDDIPRKIQNGINNIPVWNLETLLKIPAR